MENIVLIFYSTSNQVPSQATVPAEVLPDQQTDAGKKNNPPQHVIMKSQLIPQIYPSYLIAKIAS